MSNKSEIAHSLREIRALRSELDALHSARKSGDKTMDAASTREFKQKREALKAKVISYRQLKEKS